jgi:hypothetical protein
MPGSFRLDLARRAGGLLPGSVEEVDRMAVKKIRHPTIGERRARDAARSGWLAACEGI